LAGAFPQSVRRAGEAGPVAAHVLLAEECPYDLFQPQIGLAGVAGPADGDEVVLVKPTAAATAGVDVIEASGDEQVGGMDLPGLPVACAGCDSGGGELQQRRSARRRR